MERSIKVPNSNLNSQKQESFLRDTLKPYCLSLARLYWIRECKTTSREISGCPLRVPCLWPPPGSLYFQAKESGQKRLSKKKRERRHLPFSVTKVFVFHQRYFLFRAAIQTLFRNSRHRSSPHEKTFRKQTS